MSGRGPQTFLKRQKEQKRMARAQAKREARQARRENRANGTQDDAFDSDLGEAPADAESEPGTAPETQAADEPAE